MAPRVLSSRESVWSRGRNGRTGNARSTRTPSVEKPFFMRTRCHHTALTALMLLFLAVCPGCSDTNATGESGSNTGSSGSASTGDYEILEFWATWCGPCKMMEPIVQKYEEETGISIRRVNVDEESELTERLGIHSIPSIVVLKDNEPVETFTGVLSPEQLRERLAPYVTP